MVGGVCFSVVWSGFVGIFLVWGCVCLQRWQGGEGCVVPSALETRTNNAHTHTHTTDAPHKHNSKHNEKKNQKAIWAIHKEKTVPLRVAAFEKALQEVTRAEIHRGFD